MQGLSQVEEVPLFAFLCDLGGSEASNGLNLFLLCRGIDAVKAFAYLLVCLSLSVCVCSSGGLKGVSGEGELEDSTARVGTGEEGP